MTVYLRDCSDYDPDPISFGGLDGLTHKATEGTMPHSAAEGTKLAARLNAARAAGVPVLGSYHVLRTPGNGGAGTLAQQLAWWVARLDDQVPWWRQWPHWVWQIDAEKWSYDQVSALTVLQFASLLTGSGLPGWKVTYASRGQYGDNLTGIPTPLWNADYRGNGTYLGDTWASANGQPAGWAPYSGQTPVLLQYSGGPDMNAYRGSLTDLLNLTGGDDMTPEEHQMLLDLHQRSNWEVSPATVTPAQAAQNITPASATGGVPIADSLLANLDAMTRAGANSAGPTDAQVDAAVAKVMGDPAWLAQLGAAVASHIHVS